ncbi:hypothetical protein ACIRO1_29690 [Streptomyces sp. NPDC102381]
MLGVGDAALELVDVDRCAETGLGPGGFAELGSQTSTRHGPASAAT